MLAKNIGRITFTHYLKKSKKVIIFHEISLDTTSNNRCSMQLLKLCVHSVLVEKMLNNSPATLLAS